MRVCFISTEMAGIGSYGGFGCLTRDIAGGLAARGVETYVVIPRQAAEKPVQVIDGVTVLSCPISYYTNLKGSQAFAAVFKMIDADVYHSEEPCIGTCLAQMAEPNKRHLITFQDPRTAEERGESSASRPRKSSSLISRVRSKIRSVASYGRLARAARNADALYCQAWYVVDKAKALYGLRGVPGFLPNPVEMPQRPMQKATHPTVCFLGRWDPRKRPEYFFRLAQRFPDVKFVAMGACHRLRDDRDRMLREKYGSISNLEMVGWAQGEEKSRILEKAWILVNTSWRECLPVSYLEACAHKCGILSHENPDDFASNFGYWAQRGDIEDFVRGLQYLLEGGRWRESGEKGWSYVKNTHEFSRVIDRHIGAYEEALQM